MPLMPIPLCEELSALEQGLVLAALLDPREDASAPLERVTPTPSGQRSADAYGALRERGSTERRRAAVLLSRRLFSPVPAHLDQVHPSWLRHLLERQPPTVARLVMEALPSAILDRLGQEERHPEPLDVQGWVRAVLCRRVLGQLEPMPPPLEPGEEITLRALPRLPAQHLVPLLCDLGLLVLAQLVSRAADPALLESVAASLPVAMRQRFRRAASSSLPRLRDTASLLGRTAEIPIQERLCRLALQIVVPTLAPHEQRQLAQRLPHDLGLIALQVAPSPSGGQAAGGATAADLLRTALSWSEP
jgi:hypothetical protein